jgi:hypothetical protein
VKLEEVKLSVKSKQEEVLEKEVDKGVKRRIPGGCWKRRMGLSSVLRELLELQIGVEGDSFSSAWGLFSKLEVQMGVEGAFLSSIWELLWTKLKEGRLSVNAKQEAEVVKEVNVGVTRRIPGGCSRMKVEVEVEDEKEGWEGMTTRGEVKGEVVLIAGKEVRVMEVRCMPGGCWNEGTLVELKEDVTVEDEKWGWEREEKGEVVLTVGEVIGHQ